MAIRSYFWNLVCECFHRRVAVLIAIIEAVILGILHPIESKFPERSEAFDVLTYIFAIAIAGTLLLGLFWEAYSLHQEQEKKMNYVDQTQLLIRNALALFIDTGRCFLEKYASLHDHNCQLEEEANKWALEVEEFLKEHLGIRYALSFRNWIGIVPPEPPVPPHLRVLWAGVYSRVTRLDKLLQEAIASPLSIETNLSFSAEEKKSWSRLLLPCIRFCRQYASSKRIIIASLKAFRLERKSACHLVPEKRFNP